MANRFDNSRDRPTVPREHGNQSAVTLRSLYERWNAAYRGLSPHGVVPGATNSGRYVPSPTDDSPDQNDEPLPFNEDQTYFDSAETDELFMQNIVPLPVVITNDISNDAPTKGSFCTFYTESVQSVSTQRIVVPQRNRVSVMLFNAGPGTVWIAQDESHGFSGFPLIPIALTSTTPPNPLELRTTREIWAIQQSGQSSNAAVSIILQYDRSLEPEF